MDTSTKAAHSASNQVLVLGSSDQILLGYSSAQETIGSGEDIDLGTVAAADSEGGVLSRAVVEAMAAAKAMPLRVDGFDDDLARNGTDEILSLYNLNDLSGSYHVQPHNDWGLETLASSGSNAFELSLSQGLSTISSSQAVSFNGSPEGPVQYVVIDDSAPVLTADIQALWEEGLRSATRHLEDLLADPNREALFREVFGRAATDDDTFHSRLQELLATLSKPGLQIDVDLRTNEELGGAFAAYAAVGHTGSERIYVNGDKLNSGELSLDVLVSALLEEYGHALDQRLNSGVDSPGDEGQLFASEVTGVTLTVEQRAVIEAENDRGILVIEGVAVNAERAATALAVVNSYLTTNSALNETTAAAIPLRITYDSQNNNGADLLVAAFNGSTLIGWTTYNRDSNLDAGNKANDTGTIDLTFNLAQFDKQFASGGLTIHAWQGTTGYTSTVNNANPGLTSGSSTTNVNFNTNSTSTDTSSFGSNSSNVPTFDSIVTNASATWSNLTLNFSPVINSNGGGNTATVSVAENQSAVTSVAATDAGDTITYSIAGGVDADKFAINASNGALTFKDSPDFESPADELAGFVGAAVTTNFGNATSGTLSLPSNLKKGDIVIIGVGSDGAEPALPADWTNIDNTSRGSEDTRTAYLIVGDTTPSNPSITGIATASVGFAFAIRGLDAASINPTPSITTGNSGMPNPGSATTGANSLVLVIGYLDDDDVASVSPPSGYTLLTSANSGITTSDGQTIMVAYKFDDNTSNDPGAFGGDGSDEWVALTLPLGVLPAAAALDNSYQVIVQASDGKGGVDLQTINVNVTDVNDAPIVSAPASFTVSEDVAGNLLYTGTPFADVDSSSLTVTLSITDGTINATTGSGVTVGGTGTARTFSSDTTSALNTFFTTAGNITYTTAPNNNTARTLTTQVSDGGASPVSTTSTVNITAVNDAPSITSTASASFAENGTGTVYTATGSDPDAGTSLSYSLAGADAALFSIDSATGVVTFKTPPNFESPQDSGSNNVYDFTVTASDGYLSSTAQAVAISVSDVNDAPTLNANGASIQGDFVREVGFDIANPRTPVAFMQPGQINLADVDSSSFSQITVRIRNNWVQDGSAEKLLIKDGSSTLATIDLAPASGGYSGTAPFTLSGVSYTATLGELRKL